MKHDQRNCENSVPCFDCERKVKTYQVIWTESMRVNVRAASEEEARDIVLNCEHDESQVSSELDSPPEAYEIK